MVGGGAFCFCCVYDGDAVWVSTAVGCMHAAECNAFVIWQQHKESVCVPLLKSLTCVCVCVYIRVPANTKFDVCDLQPNNIRESHLPGTPTPPRIKSKKTTSVLSSLWCLCVLYVCVCVCFVKISFFVFCNTEYVIRQQYKSPSGVHATGTGLQEVHQIYSHRQALLSISES